MKISFWRRKSKTAGLNNIYSRVTVSGKYVDICSTGVEIRTDHWDGEWVTDQDPDAQFKNQTIDTIRTRLWLAYNSLFSRHETITPQKIKRAFLEQTGGWVTMTSAFEQYIKDSKVDQEWDLRDSIITVYDNIRKKLVDFLIHEKALDLLDQDFDLTWLKKYRRWMKKVKLDGGKIGHADSYVAKHSQTIRNMFTWAKLEKFIHDNLLEGYHAKGAVFDDPVFLTEEQFQTLRSYEFDNPHMQQAADVFIVLFCAGAGSITAI